MHSIPQPFEHLFWRSSSRFKSTMVSAGQLVWVSFRPLLRLVMSVFGGFVITKADIFPAAAARGAGQIALNITMPCLMFSKMVPAFSSSNISVLGVLTRGWVSPPFSCPPNSGSSMLNLISFQDRCLRLALSTSLWVLAWPG